MLAFRRRPTNNARLVVDPAAGHIGVCLPTALDLGVVLRTARADAERELSDPKPHLMPNAELRAAVETLMQTLLKHREEFNQCDPSGRLRRVYERFRYALEEAGFRV